MLEKILDLLFPRSKIQKKFG